VKAWCPRCRVDHDVPFQPSKDDLLCPGCGRPLQSSLAKRRQERQATQIRAFGRAGFAAASPAQKRKVVEHPFCIACGIQASTYVAIDPAHLTKRQHGGCDHELCVVPLCRGPQSNHCHRRWDEGDLDLLPVLTARWPAQREEVQHMLEHLGPVSMVERLANSKTQWEDLAA
jgi:hypothetical protein